MKPKPSGFNFEEKSARAILRPFSHHKYIHEPPVGSVVYISRRNGIVPLFRYIQSYMGLPILWDFGVFLNWQHIFPSWRPPDL